MSRSASQKMFAAGTSRIGSTGKSQPPSLADLIRQRVSGGGVSGPILEVQIVGFVTSKPLPGDIGCGRTLDVIVIDRGSPTRCVGRHHSPPQIQAFDGEDKDSRMSCLAEA